MKTMGSIIPHPNQINSRKIQLGVTKEAKGGFIATAFQLVFRKRH
jgi:hypothetical protein